MEQGAEIINFAQKKIDRENRIIYGEHFEAGRKYRFKNSVRVEIVPEGDESGGGANMLIPAELPAGEYECFGFDEEARAYKFRGKPRGETKERELLISVITLLEG